MLRETAEGFAMMQEELQSLVRRTREGGGRISAQVEEEALIVILDAPERLNSFDVATHRALAAVLDFAAAQNGVRSVIISGQGRAFSSGQDLGSVGEPGDEQSPSRLLRDWYGPLVLRIREAPFPVIAAVNGIAAGGATNIALACDIVIAARSARFVQGFTKLGLVPDCGATWLLPRLVGDARARAMMLLDEAIDGDTAQRIGLIYRCVEDHELLATARQIAGTLGSMPRAAIARIKRAQLATWQNDLAQQLDLECKLQKDAEEDPAFREGIAAFTERRKPVFR